MALKGKRRLAALWFADIVGYTALSSHDEDSALGVVGELQVLTRRIVPSHGGRVVKFVGDGVLTVFDSADSALNSALALLAAFTSSDIALGTRSSIRIGLHIGEVVEGEDGDVYGDGVNAASRIEEAAEPGQILVSDAAYRVLRQQAKLALTDVGVAELKGLPEPVRLYSVTDASKEPRTVPSPTTSSAAPTSRRWDEEVDRRLDLKERLFELAVSRPGLGLARWRAESWADDWLDTWPHERASEYVDAFAFARSSIKKSRSDAEAFAEKWLSEHEENEFYRYADLFDFLSSEGFRKSASATESLADELITFDDAELRVFQKAYRVGRSMGKSRADAERDALREVEDLY